MFCERMDRESERAFAYFGRYRDMAPPRDITKLLSIKLNGKTSSIRTLRKWKSEFRWDNRCREFDAEILRRSMDERIQERAEILHELLDSDIEIIRSVKGKVSEGLANLKGGQDLDVYKLYSLVKSWDVARIWLQESVALVDWMKEEQDDA